eukprot:1262249-Pleurochrysis_carterae.AAC.1
MKVLHGSACIIRLSAQEDRAVRHACYRIRGAISFHSNSETSLVTYRPYGFLTQKMVVMYA